MINVTCRIVPETNSIFVWRDGSLVGLVEEVGGEAELTVYGVPNKPTVLSFNDLEIIQDNWNQLQEIMRELKKKIDFSIDGGDEL